MSSHARTALEALRDSCQHRAERAVGMTVWVVYNGVARTLDTILAGAFAELEAEVERLRGDLDNCESSLQQQVEFREDAEAALAGERAKVARVEALHGPTSTNGHGPDYCKTCSDSAQEWVKWPCAVAAALSESAGTSGGRPADAVGTAASTAPAGDEAPCPTCGKARDDQTPGPHKEGWGICPESFHFRPVDAPATETGERA